MRANSRDGLHQSDFTKYGSQELWLFRLRQTTEIYIPQKAKLPVDGPMWTYLQYGCHHRLKTVTKANKCVSVQIELNIVVKHERSCRYGVYLNLIDMKDM